MLPGTQLTAISEGQPPQNKAQTPIKTRVIWFLDRFGSLDLHGLLLFPKDRKNPVPCSYPGGFGHASYLKYALSGDLGRIHATFPEETGEHLRVRKIAPPEIPQFHSNLSH